ncbi:hypothetical protein ABPG73_022744, partial [Tetrahymena malaccensis]
MEQYSNSFTNLDDFVKSKVNELTSIDLQLENCKLNDEQLSLLNTCLKKGEKLETLILNLQKQSISDSQINKLYAKYTYIKKLIGICDNMSNDQQYAHIQKLYYAFGKISNIPSVYPNQNQMQVQGYILLQDVFANLINLKNLKLNF